MSLRSYLLYLVFYFAIIAIARYVTVPSNVPTTGPEVEVNASPLPALAPTPSPQETSSGVVASMSVPPVSLTASQKRQDRKDTQAMEVRTETKKKRTFAADKSDNGPVEVVSIAGDDFRARVLSVQKLSDSVGWRSAVVRLADCAVLPIVYTTKEYAVEDEIIVHPFSIGRNNILIARDVPPVQAKRRPCGVSAINPSLSVKEQVLARAATSSQDVVGFLWYHINVFADGKELTVHTPNPHISLGQKVVLQRLSDGTAIADAPAVP